jgi:hypothetical protein
MIKEQTICDMQIAAFILYDKLYSSIVEAIFADVLSISSKLLRNFIK